MPRIALGPGEVAGYFAGLRHGFEQIGVECEHFLLSPHIFDYGIPDHFLASTYARAMRFRLRAPRFLRPLGKLYTLVLRMLIFAYAIRACDLFIFPGYGSFFRFFELPLLKLLGKRVVVIFFGSDARPPFFSGRHIDDLGRNTDARQSYREAKAMYRRIRRVERYAQCIVNHTATDQFFTREYVRIAAIGLPARPIESRIAPAHEGIRIVHAPSRPIAKGTHVFRRIVEELRAEGWTIDYRELIGVPNERVLAELAECDFVLDELYSDVPMAMLATEAAMLGKPTLVGSYYAQDFAKDNPDAEQPPSLFIHPDEAKAALRRLVENEGFRRELGAQARDFVRRQWSPDGVARRLLAAAEGNPSRSWISQPNANNYIWGWGLSRMGWKSQLQEYITQNGVSALIFDHNTVIRNKVHRELSRPAEVSSDAP